MRRSLARKLTTLSSSVVQRVSPRSSPLYPNILETVSSTNPSTLTRPLPMVLPYRLLFLLVRPPRRRKTCCCLMLRPSPLVSPCRAMCSELSSHGTRLFRPTSPAYSLPSRTIRRPSRSLCMSLLVFGYVCRLSYKS